MRQLLLKLKQNSGMLLAFFCICQLLIINCQFVQAQVSVNIDGSNADASAMFEVKSTDKGLLPPRMTTAQRDAIASPAEGLTIYNLDDKEMEFFNGNHWRKFFYPTSSAITCGGEFYDFRDDQIYSTIQIGDQCWLLKNLDVGVMLDGDVSASNNGIIEKHCYNNDPSNCEIYGGLYDWDEMMQYSVTAGVQGICPVGWHLPSDPEWMTLFNFLGGISVAGGKMKETGFSHWMEPNQGATNESGFTCLGGGLGYSDGSGANLTRGAYFWGSTLFNPMFAYFSSIGYNDGGIYHNIGFGRDVRLSVRCIRNN